MKKEPLPFYKGDELVGHLLEASDGALSFVYADSWKGEPVSPALPVDGTGNVYAFFRELMPDERRRKAFETLTRLSLRRVREFLAIFGEDLPGDLSIVPASSGRRPEDITRLISMSIGSGGSLDRATMGSSLGGADPKAAVIVKREDDGIRFFSPSPAWSSTHILKSPGAVSAIEDCTMQLARATGLFPVAKVEPVAIRGNPFLLVERFDRYMDPDGKIRKLAQEDFCQATGNLARYGSEDGGVGMEDMVRAIFDRLPKEALETFLRMSFFSMLVGNSDDHAGNYAFLKNRQGEWTLAPAYDLVSVATLKELEKEGFFGGRSMLALLSLDQPRKFGRHYDALETDSLDIDEACRVFGMEKETLSALFGECRESVMHALTASFEAERTRAWDALELHEDIRELSLTGIQAFMRTVSARAEAVAERFADAFGERSRPGPR